MAIDPELLRILVCPVDREALKADGNDLVCEKCRRRYPVRDGIPSLLIEDAARD